MKFFDQHLGNLHLLQEIKHVFLLVQNAERKNTVSKFMQKINFIEKSSYLKNPFSYNNIILALEISASANSRAFCSFISNRLRRTLILLYRYGSFIINHCLQAAMFFYQCRYHCFTGNLTIHPLC